MRAARYAGGKDRKAKPEALLRGRLVEVTPAQMVALPSRVEGYTATGGIYGTLTEEETRRRFLAGDPPPDIRSAFEAERNRWRDRVGRLAAALPSRRRRLRHRDSGDVVDLGRYLTDRPDCWERLERGRTLPSVTLGLNLSKSSGNGPAVFASTAGTVAACAWALCESGFAVRVVLCDVAANVRFRGTNEGAAFGGVYWRAKDWQEPLDVGRVLAAGMPGVMRRYTTSAAATLADMNVNTYCIEPPRELYQRMGIDVALGRTWAQDCGALVEALRLPGFDRAV